MSRAMFESDAERKEKLKKQFCEDNLPKNLKFLEKKLADNGGKFIAGGDSVGFFSKFQIFCFEITCFFYSFLMPISP